MKEIFNPNISLNEMVVITLLVAFNNAIWGNYVVDWVSLICKWVSLS